MVIQTFEYTGGSQVFTVPNRVRNVTFRVWGAQGGNAAVPEGARGGLGGFAEGSVKVLQGDQFTINVGGQGQPGGTVEMPPGDVPGGAGGFGGGGDGGQGNIVPDATIGDGGSGGGGASSVLKGVTSLLIAGGGGGVGGRGDRNGTIFQGDDGGLGGGSSGTAGQAGTLGDVGEGGTQVAGGTGGSGPIPSAGDDGGLGFGGDGGGPTGAVADQGVGGGGGGGGGYYGGGGGAAPPGPLAPDGGAGGSGGGGSSFGSPLLLAGSYETIQGLRQGNGLVQVIYEYEGARNVVVRTKCDAAVVYFNQPGASPPSGSVFPVGTTRVTYFLPVGGRPQAFYFNVIVQKDVIGFNRQRRLTKCFHK